MCEVRRKKKTRSTSSNIRRRTSPNVLEEKTDNSDVISQNSSLVVFLSIKSLFVWFGSRGPQR